MKEITITRRMIEDFSDFVAWAVETNNGRFEDETFQWLNKLNKFFASDAAIVSVNWECSAVPAAFCSYRNLF